MEADNLDGITVNAGEKLRKFSWSGGPTAASGTDWSGGAAASLTLSRYGAQPDPKCPRSFVLVSRIKSEAKC